MKDKFNPEQRRRLMELAGILEEDSGEKEELSGKVIDPRTMELARLIVTNRLDGFVFFTNRGGRHNEALPKYDKNVWQKFSDRLGWYISGVHASGVTGIWTFCEGEIEPVIKSFVWPEDDPYKGTIKQPEKKDRVLYQEQQSIWSELSKIANVQEYSKDREKIEINLNTLQKILRKGGIKAKLVDAEDYDWGEAVIQLSESVEPSFWKEHVSELKEWIRGITWNGGDFTILTGNSSVMTDDLILFVSEDGERDGLEDTFDSMEDTAKDQVEDSGESWKDLETLIRQFPGLKEDLESIYGDYVSYVTFENYWRAVKGHFVLIGNYETWDKPQNKYRTKITVLA